MIDPKCSDRWDNQSAGGCVSATTRTYIRSRSSSQGARTCHHSYPTSQQTSFSQTSIMKIFSVTFLVLAAVATSVLGQAYVTSLFVHAWCYSIWWLEQTRTRLCRRYIRKRWSCGWRRPDHCSAIRGHSGPPRWRNIPGEAGSRPLREVRFSIVPLWAPEVDLSLLTRYTTKSAGALEVCATQDVQYSRDKTRLTAGGSATEFGGIRWRFALHPKFGSVYLEFQVD